MSNSAARFVRSKKFRKNGSNSTTDKVLPKGFGKRSKKNAEITQRQQPPTSVQEQIVNEHSWVTYASPAAVAIAPDEVHRDLVLIYGKQERSEPNLIDLDHMYPQEVS